MNAPIPAIALAAQSPTQMVPPFQVRPSPFNRKHFDEQKHKELTENVAVYGVLQPILVRPWKAPASHKPIAADPKFELVFGERRWRAATAAKLEQIPVMVRELDDIQVIKLQIIENQKREDVHPLEEAESYEHLLKVSAKAGTKLTPEQIGKDINKSRSHVYGVLKYLDLCKEARAAFYSGELDRSKATLIARIGHHETQAQALREILGQGASDDQPMSFRDAQYYIAEHFMLSLKAPPFDVKRVYFRKDPLEQIAGGCPECPRRTGNMTDLFTDAKQDPNVCTDPKCFGEKKAAANLETIAAAKKDGVKVISGEAAKKLKPYEHSNQLRGGYSSLDEQVPIYKGAEYKGYDTLRKVAGKELAAHAALLEDPRTLEVIPIVRDEDVKKVLAAKGLSLSHTTGGRRSDDSQKAAERRARIETTARIRVLAEIRKANRTRAFGLDETRLVAATLFELLGFDLQKAVVDAWNIDAGIEKPKGIEYVHDFGPERIATMDAVELKVLMLDVVLIGECRVNNFSRSEGKLLHEHAKRCKVNADKIIADTKAAFAEKKKAAAKPKNKFAKTAQGKAARLAAQKKASAK